MAVEIVLNVSNRKFPSWLKVKENLLIWGNEKFWGDLVQVWLDQELRCR